MSVWLLLLLLCHAASATGVAANTTASHFGDPSVTYRYVQFKATGLRGGQNAVQLAEFAFYNADGQQMYMSAATNPGGDHPPDGAPGNAIDGELSTKWFDGNNGGIIIDFSIMGGGRDLQTYTWATADDSPGRDPVSWTLQGSADKQNWVSLDARNGIDITQDRGVWNARWSLSGIAPTPAPLPVCYVTQAIGCFDDHDRILANMVYDGQDVTWELCAQKCQQAGFGDDSFKGVEYSTQCFCDNAIKSQTPAYNCNSQCAGNPAQPCGGSYAINVYKVGARAHHTPTQAACRAAHPAAAHPT